MACPKLGQSLILKWYLICLDRKSGGREVTADAKYETGLGIRKVPGRSARGSSEPVSVSPGIHRLRGPDPLDQRTEGPNLPEWQMVRPVEALRASCFLPRPSCLARLKS